MPFTKNQIITLEIEALSNDGNGVAHKDGQAVFVPLTAPGDVAEVRIVKPMKTYAFGRVEKLLTAGPGRVKQDCPVAYYDLDGRRLQQPRHGLNIVRFASGKSVVKVVK